MTAPALLCILRPCLLHVLFPRAAVTISCSCPGNKLEALQSTQAKGAIHHPDKPNSASLSPPVQPGTLFKQLLSGEREPSQARKQCNTSCYGATPNMENILALHFMKSLQDYTAATRREVPGFCGDSPNSQRGTSAIQRIFSSAQIS
jgi:hypothetical protein